MDPFGGLSDTNNDQIRKYLRFFQQKKESLMRSLTAEFSDAKMDKLNEDMYSKDDVEDFADFLSSAVKVKKSFSTL